ncbi:hypothetical protein [uncultured Paludibaculum sp.]|uniref:hypothetical protein n=1 Tax=uncultured Paludibaculum sp. TaxID=1765020 RepID=UPI002AABAA19|nr:hypothetical protein [uncultured Paludibaculum sp.]
MARLSHEQAIDNLVALFEEEALRIAAKARRETLYILQIRLAVTDGVIDRTQANARALNQVEAIYKRAMRAAGYDTLVQEYVNSFNGQFVFFSDVLAALGDSIGRNLTFTFGDRDKALFLQQQAQASLMLHQAVDIQAKAAQQQAMFSIGNIRAADLTRMISEKLDLTAGRAGAVADTSLSTFYRTVADRGYQQVEASLGQRKRLKIRYRFGGPNDKLTRPFCVHALAGAAYSGLRGVKVLASAGDRAYTREEIDQMSNGQLPNVMATCGGFRCRHQWMMVIDELPNTRIQKKQAKRAK